MKRDPVAAPATLPCSFSVVAASIVNLLGRSLLLECWNTEHGYAQLIFDSLTRAGASANLPYAIVGMLWAGGWSA